MNTRAPEIHYLSVRTGIIALLLALLIFPAAICAQNSISKEEYQKRQKGLLEAIAKMEAEEARQLASGTKLKAEQAKNAAQEAERERILKDAPGLAPESATIAKAKADNAAREKRLRANASPTLLAQLDKKTPVVAAEGDGPKPGAKPIPLSEREKTRKKKGKKEDKEIEILAQGGSTFNAKANLIVFEDEVVVNHPQFDLLCDRLIVFLKKDPKEGESTLDKAIATGKKVIVRKVGADGEVQIGQARKVTFEGDSGDVVLEDWPQVQSGFKLVQAKAQSTIITLTQDLENKENDGKMKVSGPSYTKILQPAKAPKQPVGAATAKTGDAP